MPIGFLDIPISGDSGPLYLFKDKTLGDLVSGTP